jgi:hypothetical protein
MRKTHQKIMDHDPAREATFARQRSAATQCTISATAPTQTDAAVEDRLKEGRDWATT